MHIPTRKIIHCDADCFFAAVEVRDNPKLQGLPVAVGGSEDRRGVISTCNYAARRYGVRSAMATVTAKKLCPDLMVVPHNMAKYRDVSQQMGEIFHDYSDLVEPLSLDEAFIDVSDSSRLSGSATRIAEEMRQRIFDKTAITVSAGVSNCKFVAKIASDWHKPNGLCVVPPDQVDAFVAQLPVGKLFGVGQVTEQKLQRLGFYRCADIRESDLSLMAKHFGRQGLRLWDLSHGRDNRPVQPERERKSLSVEQTFAEDLPGCGYCLQKLPELLLDLRQRMNRLSEQLQVSKAFVKVKFNDFSTTTLERVGTSARIADYQSLMRQALTRCDRPVRLLGIGVRFGRPHTKADCPEQLSLFDVESA